MMMMIPPNIYLRNEYLQVFVPQVFWVYAITISITIIIIISIITSILIAIIINSTKDDIWDMVKLKNIHEQSSKPC